MNETKTARGCSNCKNKTDDGRRCSGTQQTKEQSGEKQMFIWTPCRYQILIKREKQVAMVKEVGRTIVHVALMSQQQHLWNSQPQAHI
ncbi:hypothetical protein QL285_045478 [Trifolium repens]|nr:hypothetical protein QL285_045478 [Trifolium repens]